MGISMVSPSLFHQVDPALPHDLGSRTLIFGVDQTRLAESAVGLRCVLPRDLASRTLIVGVDQTRLAESAVGLRCVIGVFIVPLISLWCRLAQLVQPCSSWLMRLPQQPTGCTMALLPRERSRYSFAPHHHSPSLLRLNQYVYTSIATYCDENDCL